MRFRREALLDLEFHGLQNFAVLHHVAAPIARGILVQRLGAVRAPGRSADVELHASDFGGVLVPNVLDVAVSGVRDFAEAIELSDVRLERIGGARERPIRDGCSDRRLDRCRRFRRRPWSVARRPRRTRCRPTRSAQDRGRRPSPDRATRRQVATPLESAEDSSPEGGST